LNDQIEKKTKQSKRGKKNPPRGSSVAKGDDIKHPQTRTIEARVSTQLGMSSLRSENKHARSALREDPHQMNKDTMEERVKPEAFPDRSETPKKLDAVNIEPRFKSQFKDLVKQCGKICTCIRHPHPSGSSWMLVNKPTQEGTEFAIHNLNEDSDPRPVWNKTFSRSCHARYKVGNGESVGVEWMGPADANTATVS